MEVLGRILTDWESCRPSDGSIPEDRLQEVLDRATARILDSPAPSQMQQDAYALLEPEAGEAMGDGGRPPLLERMLLRGRCYAHGGSSPSSAGAPGGSGLAGDPGAGGRIHFLRFWQAWQELERRLGQPSGQGDEPLAEELVIFRDTLLRHASSAEGLTGQKLASEAAAARAMSADEAAWFALEEATARLCSNQQHAAAVASFATATVAAASASRGRQAAFPPPGGEAPGSAGRAPPPAAATPPALGAAELCGVLLGWLHEMAEDYDEGPRAAKVRAVMDVCRCNRREACFQLGARGWDVEAAMMGYYGKACGGGSPLGGSAGQLTSWSSQGAKLRQNEVDCPICAEPYASGAKPVVIKCCFQVLCKSCHERLTQPAGVWPEAAFQCPFCRGVERRTSGSLWQPTQQGAPQQPATTGRSFSLGAIFGRTRRSGGGAIGGVLGTMGQAANEAARALEELAATFREDETPLTGGVPPPPPAAAAGREGRRGSRATAPRTPAQPRGASASARQQRIWDPS